MTSANTATAPPWPAPPATGPVRATVTVPGSKSATNRALVLAALATGTSRVNAPLVSRDTSLMADGLRTLGIAVDTADADTWQVTGTPTALDPAAGRIDCGLAGTVARFLPPVAALAAGSVTFDGDPRMRERPMAPLLAALRALGAEVDDGGRGALPVTVRGDGRPPRGGPVTVDASSSSQLVSGLLLAAPRYAEGVTVRHDGPAPVPSAPHLTMTVEMLRDFGARVETAEDTWRVEPGPLTARDVDVEPDLSNALPFLAAAAATGGTVTITGWPRRTAQPGALVPDLLAAMGASYTIAGEGLTLTGPDRLTGLDADLRDCSEATPTLAALAALATTPSRLTGIAHIRRHETDRIAALARELTALGGDVDELPDGLVIRPRPLHGGVVSTYHDHRIATAAAVLGLVVRDLLVEDVATTGKTLPGFAAMWTAMLAGG